MDIILREDIDKLGSRGQVVKVANGYARNFLLPRKLAVAATASNKKIIEQERQAHLRRETKQAADATELAKIMQGVVVTIRQKAGEQSQLFGSVTAQDIADGLAKLGYTIERKKIQLDDAIKQLGDYQVPLKLHRDVSTEITVKVEREE
ncbi:MAG TPA: 50S ribosomal protein L9 [Bryobacteraceae bacterium]|nr:50S ribosomal protein L9 [Bryobacteraceae bacterium]